MSFFCCGVCLCHSFLINYERNIGNTKCCLEKLPMCTVLLLLTIIIIFHFCFGFASLCHSVFAEFSNVYKYQRLAVVVKDETKSFIEVLSAVVWQHLVYQF